MTVRSYASYEAYASSAFYGSYGARCWCDGGFGR